MNLKKGIVQVFLANIINLLFSVCNGFLLPRYLSMESYAGFKTFLLYTSYIWALHFGYLNGVYIRYGGKDKAELQGAGFRHTRKALFYFQAMVMAGGIAVAVMLRNMALLCAVISILPNSMVTLYKMAYQAVGDFYQYRLLCNTTTAMTLSLNVASICFGIDNAYWYIGIQLTAMSTVFLYYEWKFWTIGKTQTAGGQDRRRKWHGKRKKQGRIQWVPLWPEIKQNISFGFAVMLGAYIGVWITGLDKWFVKMFCCLADFAYYSFADSMLKIVNTIITAFSATLYHYFCKEQDLEKVGSLRRCILMVGAVTIAAIYPLRVFISFYLESYMEAVPIIIFIYAAQYFITVIHAVYSNLYQALGMRKMYLKRMATVLPIAFLLNFALGQIYGHGTKVYAAATLLSAVIWLLLCQKDLRQCRMMYKEWGYSVMVMLGYFYCNTMPAALGLFAYILWIFAVSNVLLRQEVGMLYGYAVESGRKIKGRYKKGN